MYAMRHQISQHSYAFRSLNRLPNLISSPLTKILIFDLARPHYPLRRRSNRTRIRVD